MIAQVTLQDLFLGLRPHNRIAVKPSYTEEEKVREIHKDTDSSIINILRKYLVDSGLT